MPAPLAVASAVGPVGSGGVIDEATATAVPGRGYGQPAISEPGDPEMPLSRGSAPGSAAAPANVTLLGGVKAPEGALAPGGPAVLGGAMTAGGLASSGVVGMPGRAKAPGGIADTGLAGAAGREAGRLAGWPEPEPKLDWAAGPPAGDITTGECFTRLLPLDATCAGAARSYFREALAQTDLPADLVHDGVTMASELAANTLNAHGNVEFSGSGRRPVTGIPEFWLYLRSHRFGMELICKVFDSEPDWEAFEPAAKGAKGKASPDSVRGRGLQLVAGLSAGHWGHHPTRGRLGAWKVPGKAVWFALRVPPASELTTISRPVLRGGQAIDALAAALGQRGLADGLVRVPAQRGDLAVLSVHQRLTVWCNGEYLNWKAPDGTQERLRSVDLVEAAERIVCAHETLTGADGADLA